MIFNPNPPATDRKVRVFKLSASFLEEFEGEQPDWGFGGLSYFTYKRTYSRQRPDGTSEEFWQTCQRVVEGCFNLQKIHCQTMGLLWDEPKAQKSAQDMYRRLWQFKWTPPGRGLWMMGTDLVYEKGSAPLNNCAFVSTENLHQDFAAPFTFLMDMSMLGVGVGGDTRGEGKARITVPKFTETPFIVEDSREGWVDLIRVILQSFVGKGQFPTNIDYRNVRPRGAPIRGFGGIASGAGPLQKLVEGLTRLLMPEGVAVAVDVEMELEGGTLVVVNKITDHLLATARPLIARFEIQGEGKPYRIQSDQIVDVFNYIGKCVVAGGVRRTAEIMFGDVDDPKFMGLKDNSDLTPMYTRRDELEALIEKDGASDWQDELRAVQDAIQSHPLNDRRWASNNSVFGQLGMDYDSLADRIAQNGEPGIFWLENARQYGRMGDLPDGKDHRVMGANPCSEQSLESFELCNLVETYPAHAEDLDDYKKTLKMAYLYAKTVTLVPTHDPRANLVMQRNRRIGCSMSGIAQARQKLGHRKYLDWCDEGYAYIQDLDRIYSEWLGIPMSKKTTSVKPSGTVSLLSGATPGIHFPHSEYYIRRVRVSGTSPLVAAAKAAGYKVEVDQYADDTVCVEFPIHEKNFDRSKSDVSIWEQMSLAAALQRHWADNQVSVTVTFSKAEVKDIARCLEAFEDQLKSISMLPLSEHGYAQAPYETIDEATYNQMVAGIRPLNFGGADTHDLSAEDKFCSGDTCTIDFAAMIPNGE